MIRLGETNRLRVRGETDAGLLLDGGKDGDLFLPAKQADPTLVKGDQVDVFVYLDSEDFPAATTAEPRIEVGRVAFLRVAQVNPTGAFLDWGLPKDLLVPYGEQPVPMEEGESYLVYAYLDERTSRIVASAKLDRFLASTVHTAKGEQEEGQRVELFAHSRTDLGYKCVVDHRLWGVLYYDDVFRPLDRGQRVFGYIKKIRGDGKIDLCLQPPGGAGTDELTRRILRKLKQRDGFLDIDDKSDPRDIYGLFGVSKKAFKKATGALYKQRRVTFPEGGGIRLAEEADE